MTNLKPGDNVRFNAAWVALTGEPTEFDGVLESIAEQKPHKCRVRWDDGKTQSILAMYLRRVPPPARPGTIRAL